MRQLLTTLGAFFILSAVYAQNMDNQRLDQLIRGEATEIEGRDGAWTFLYKERAMLMLTDEGNNRMRIVTPIDEVSNLSEQEFMSSLMANFHTALDVKYAVADDLIWSVFIHPLKELSDEQLLDALEQVARAADSFGTTYSSTDLFFPGRAPESEPKADPGNKKKKT